MNLTRESYLKLRFGSRKLAAIRKRYGQRLEKVFTRAWERHCKRHDEAIEKLSLAKNI